MKEDPLLRVRLDALRLKARIESREGNWEEARRMLTQAASVIESQLRLGEADIWQLAAMGDTQIELAGVLRKLGLFEREMACYAVALAAYRRLHETIPDSADYFESIALSLLDRAQLLLELRRFDELDRDLNDALPMIAQLVTQFPEASRYRQELGVGLEAKGRFLHLRGKYADAREALQRAVEIFTRLSDVRPDIENYRERAAAARIHLACALAALGQSQESDLAFHSAYEDLDELRTIAPDDSQFAVDLAWLHVRRGEMLWQRDDQAGAQSEFQQAIRSWTEVVTRWPSLSHDRMLADLLTSCPVVALRNPKQAVELARRSFDAAPEESLVRSTLAFALLRAGEPQDAAGMYSQPFAGAYPLARDHFVHALALHAMGDTLPAQQCFDQGRFLQNQQSGDDELRRIAAEAASTLGLRMTIQATD
jgi:tetratricopeptide (TPR) repeat protein